MKQLLMTTVFTLVSKLLFSLEPSPSSITEAGDQYFSATLYEEAAREYSNLLKKSELSQNQERFIHLQYGQCLYFLKHYQEATQHFEWGAAEDYPQQIFWMLAHCYHKTGDFEKGLAVLERAQEDDETLFEKGLLYFHWKKGDEALRIFKNLREKRTNSKLQKLASLYLARTYLMKKDSFNAKNIIELMQKDLPENDQLSLEIHFLFGEVSYYSGEYENAIFHFEKAVPAHHVEKGDWVEETLLYLGWSHMKLAAESADVAQHLGDVEAYFKQAETIFRSEQATLGLAECYLTRASLLGDRNAYVLAESILNNASLFVSLEAQSKALLLKAQSASTYAERARLYYQLTQEAYSKSGSLHREAWYFRGLNDLKEARRLARLYQIKEANHLFDSATYSFEKSYARSIDYEPERAGLALKFLAEAYFQQGTKYKKLKAYAVLERLTKELPDILNSIEVPEEIFYLKGLIAISLFVDEGEDKYFALAKEALTVGADRFPNGKMAPEILLLLGKLYYKYGDFAHADEVFSLGSERFLQRIQKSEALFWSARSKQARNLDRSTFTHLFEQVYNDYPESPFAAEAYFSLYTYKEYLQGERTAIKHLQAFAHKFATSPLTVTAYYLCGLDYTLDKKNAAGKKIRKKNLTAAIESFEQAQECFDTLYERNLIPHDELNYYLTLRYRTLLEKALTNLTIANESQGAKKTIYFEFAEDLFSKLCHDFEDSTHRYTSKLNQGFHYHPIHEESAYLLAGTLINIRSPEVVKEFIHKILERYQKAKITRGYYLSRTWYQLGLVEQEGKNHEAALHAFAQAEDAAKGKVLTTDERLDLIIQQSICLKAIDQLDLAMLALSRVINDDAISSLRVKAMFLRAELYEIQGREELARKQLEATAKKGGPWAVQASEKLKQQYGYL